MRKRYNYRAYPTPVQRRALARLFGCVRVVYNDTIADRQMVYETGLHLVEEPAPPRPDGKPRTRRSFTANRQTALITFAKDHHRPWLTQVASGPLIQAIADADRAYRNFFDSAAGKRKGAKVGFPRFKTRHGGKHSAGFMFSRDALRLTVGENDNATLRVPKVGDLRLAWSRDLPAPPSSVTITANPDGTYEVSFVVDAPAGDVEPDAGAPVMAGVDLGLADYAIIARSDGTREKVPNPRHLRHAQRRLAREQKALSRKQGPDRRTGQRPSHGWRRQAQVVARQHAKVTAARTDFQRKLALRLARETQTVAVEKLNVHGLARSGGSKAQGRGLRRSVHDAAWSAFVVRLREKMGDRLIEVPAALTSQVCGVCGTLDGPKPLHVRTWTCHDCGALLDRDFNAAVNIGTAGLAESGQHLADERVWRHQALVGAQAPTKPASVKHQPTGDRCEVTA